MVRFCRVQALVETVIPVAVSTAALPLLAYWLYWSVRLLFKKGDRL